MKCESRLNFIVRYSYREPRTCQDVERRYTWLSQSSQALMKRRPLLFKNNRFRMKIGGSRQTNFRLDVCLILRSLVWKLVFFYWFKLSISHFNRKQRFYTLQNRRLGSELKMTILPNKTRTNLENIAHV